MGLLGELFSTIDSAKRRGGALAYGLLTDPKEVLRQEIANRNNEAGQQLGLLASLYQDDQGNPTFDQSKWSQQAKSAHNSLVNDLTGAMVGNLSWNGGRIPASMQRFADHPAIDAVIQESPRALTLSKVVVPKEQRGAGIGSDFMQALTQAADEAGKKVALTPSSDFGGSKARLIEFYKRHGFVPNKGRNRDFEINESMYRMPSTGD